MRRFVRFTKGQQFAVVMLEETGGHGTWSMRQGVRIGSQGQGPWSYSAARHQITLFEAGHTGATIVATMDQVASWPIVPPSSGQGHVNSSADPSFRGVVQWRVGQQAVIGR